MEFYVFALALLVVLALIDLMVGVSNDAVNFLNSAIGSRVAPRYVIMIVASLGILAGVTFSSGMMEVARKGIFNPGFFTMPDLVTIFLAVMVADIVLLDLFNTFGLPTSTTVSIVFDLLGASLAVSIVKITQSDQSLTLLSHYINTGKVLAIISGILLSVGVAFVCGVLAQFATRLLFTFNFEKRLRRYGGLWCGMALSMITYFILIKGAKGASFLTEPMLAWIKTHTWTIIAGGFVAFAALFQLLSLVTRINILKPIVLSGTFALAMSFAANDLVNFIGVPLAGFQAFWLARGTGDPSGMLMEGLLKPVHTNTLILLASGAVMVLTMWLSRKSRTVSKTELSLGRQEEGMERFDSSKMSRIILRMVLGLSDAVSRAIPDSLRRWIEGRMDVEGFKPAPGYDGATPAFDLLRASVNMMVASALISLATSLKLPLSTTYVTFMVAMGSSLADKAWGLESAVYRITGVLMVIGGWFFTALMALSVSFVFAMIVAYFNGIGVVALLILLGFVFFRSFKLHMLREKAANELELLDLKRVTDAQYAVRTCFENSGRFLAVVRDYYSECMDGIMTQNRKQLKQLRRETSKVQKWSNVIAVNIFKTMRLLQHEDIQRADKYAHVVSALQEIAESLRDLILRCHVHTANQHAGLLSDQKKELHQVRKNVLALLEDTSRIMINLESLDMRQTASHYVELKQLLTDLDQRQIERICNGASKTRLSILFYGISNASMKISEQTLQLLTVFEETFQTAVRRKV
jgi:phosphate/sulfate permease